MCFGGTTIEVPAPPAPSPEEVRQNRLTNQLLELNIAAQGFDIVEGPDGPTVVERQLSPEDQVRKDLEETRTSELQDRVFEALGGELTPIQEEIQDLAEQRQLEELRGQPSEQTKQLVGESFTSAREMGEEDIQRFATELAGRRGFERTDSPIANAAFKAQTDLTTGLRSAEAASLLDVGQRNQFFGQALREFGEGQNLNRLNSILTVQDFQNTLRQQATQNRLSLAGFAGGLAGQTGALRAELFKPKVVESPNFLTGFGNLLLGGGGFLSGLRGGGAAAGGAAAAGFFSSQSFKHNLEALEAGDYEAVLESLQQTPVYRWTYKPEFQDERRHIGPITEQAPKEIVTEDGMAVVPIDYLGFMLAALKGLQDKVNKLEARNG